MKRITLAAAALLSAAAALHAQDFPELLTFPYLWQQVEYVLGGGSSHYMFLVLAARDLTGRTTKSK